MSENTTSTTTNDFITDLVDQDPIFTKEMVIQVATPNGTDREVKCKATMKLLSLDAYEDLKAKETVPGVVEHCLVKIEGIPGASLKDGTQLTAEQVAVRVTDICSRLFGELETRHGQNARNTILSSYERGNSKRSHRR